MPTAMTTPTTRRLEISPKPMPQAAIPMSSRLTRVYTQALIDKAHEVCPYSNATRGNIEVNITLS